MNRLLEQYGALLSFFRNTDEHSSSVRKITSTLEKPLTKLYLMFLSNALHVINVFNKLMQTESPTIHILHREVQSFVKKILLRFIRPSVVQEIQIASIDLDDSSLYLPLSEVFIGDKARRFLDGEHELDANEIRTFCECCREFWITGTKYAIKKLPVDSQFLSNLSWLHPGVRDSNLYCCKLSPSSDSRRGEGTT